MREAHPGLSCTEAGLREDFGQKTGHQPPRCKRCNRMHWGFTPCALRSREEEAEFRKLGG